MSFRLYIGPAGAEDLKPADRRALYKEFRLLDEALLFARHLGGKSGRVALLLEGDDGTRMNRREIAQATQRH